MEDLIKISELNDFIFCPISIYFHKLYNEQSTILYQSTYQTEGKNAHKSIDDNSYSTKKDILTGIDVYCEKYGLVGKIDIWDKGNLIERKKKIKVIYDGYIFQLYGQYFSMIEMGYHIERITLRSLDDNKSYNVPLPCDNLEMFKKFEETVKLIRNIDVNEYVQNNPDKCRNCIYEAACDRSLV